MRYAKIRYIFVLSYKNDKLTFLIFDVLLKVIPS